MEHAIENTKQTEHRGPLPSGVSKPASVIRPLHPMLQLQQQAGNQAVQQFLRNGVIQAKMAISHPIDPEENPQYSHPGFPVAAPCSCSLGSESCDECKKHGPVQRKSTALHEHVKAHPDALGLAAIRGVASASRPLPHLDRIQSSFGRHDVRAARIEIGGLAAVANSQMGSLAYTAGDRIGFHREPNLELAAHEATHVIQQRKGLKFPDGVGRPGDQYEQQADAVADAVHRGESAEHILNRPLDGFGTGGLPAIQHAPDNNNPVFDPNMSGLQRMGPSTVSGEMSDIAMKGKGRVAISPQAAQVDFVARFPFLPDLFETYKARIVAILTQDVVDYKDARRVDTELNRDYLSIPGMGDNMEKDVYRLRELREFESVQLNQKRTERISPDWIFSRASVEKAASPLAETDELTWLKEQWETFKTQPAYLAIDGWSSPAISIYISNGVGLWEMKQAGRPIEMMDLLGIDQMRAGYQYQAEHGPKRTNLLDAIRDAKGALANARLIFDDQVETNKDAGIRIPVAGWKLHIVVPISEYRGSGGASFDWLVSQFEALRPMAPGPEKDAAIERMVDTYENLKSAIGGGAGDAFKGVFKQHEDDIAQEMFNRKNPNLGYTASVPLTSGEKDKAHTQAYSAALDDWSQASDELPQVSAFETVQTILQFASDHLEKGDLRTTAIYANIALRRAQRLTLRMDRYKTRVTSGAALVAQALTYVKTGSELIVAVAGGAEFGLVGGAAASSTLTLIESLASGESVGTSLKEADKAFLMNLMLGKLSELMSASIVARFGLSRPVADIIGNIAASPYGQAASLIYERIDNPDAPFPDLDSIANEAMSNSLMAGLITLGAHIAGPHGGAPGEGGAVEDLQGVAEPPSDHDAATPIDATKADTSSGHSGEVADTPAERASRVEVTRNTQNELLSLHDADTQLEYLADNPNMIEGEPPHRKAKIGEHTWEEQTEDVWCRHSNGALCRRIEGQLRLALTLRGGLNVSSEIGQLSEATLRRLRTSRNIEAAVQLAERLSGRTFSEAEGKAWMARIRQNPEIVVDLLDQAAKTQTVIEPPGMATDSDTPFATETGLGTGTDYDANINSGRGGSAPHEAGLLGKDRSRRRAENAGDKWVCEEPKFRYANPDGSPGEFSSDIGMTGPSEGGPYLIESKLGPDAALTKNQIPGYQALRDGHAFPANRAAEALARHISPNWKSGDPMPVLPVRLEYWHWVKRFNDWVPRISYWR